MSDYADLVKNPSEWKSVKYDDPRLDAFAMEVEKRYELPKGMVLAVKNAGERTDPGKVSPKGAKGIMQFMDNTQKLQGGMFKHDVNNPFASIDAAGKYLQFTLNNQYKGNALAAVADYNGGPPAGKAVLKGEAPPAEETQQYVERVKTYLTEKYKK